MVQFLKVPVNGNQMNSENQIIPSIHKNENIVGKGYNVND